MSAAIENIIFQDFIPKKYIQQEEFLQKYPQYDGRGLLIAIIDGGIDVSLDGMKKTSTGLPKVIDCFDFSGAGDVDTSVIRKMGKENTLMLLSGKEVKIPKEWKNPLNEWHLGIKSLMKMKREMRGKKNNKNKKTKEDEKHCEEDKAFTVKPKDVVKTMHEYDISIDCIVWNDGKKWRTCMISASTTNLENVKVLTNFRDDNEYCFISGDDNIACCVTMKNDGKLLELFIPTREHGSYVAQAATAHYPNQPEKDGLAPGAQIVSMNVRGKCKNGNTNSAVEKALSKCIELGVDIVNISVTTKDFSKSAIINLFIKKMVNKLGIIIVQAAGNLGPFISSMRYDTNNSNDEMLTIGAVLTSDIKSSLFGNDDNNPPHLWHYSSKGPLPNGGRGVTFVAPSGAIVENPRWHPLKKHFFGGTSCASPVAAGAIACLLTALKANSIQYSPAMIKMVLSNTAFLPDGKDGLGFGNGIIQINSAFEYFNTFKRELQKVKLPQIFINKSNKKGIVFYASNNSNMNKYCIKIENNNQKQIPWILKLTPECHKHIEYSRTVKNNLFYVTVDSKKLKSGNYYYSEIHGFDPSNLSMGPMFHLPITVIVPEKVANSYIERDIFVTPPSSFKLLLDPHKSCNKCTVKLQDSENGETQFEKTIKKTDFDNIFKAYSKRRKKNLFYQTGSPDAWIIKFRWEKFFEIYIYQREISVEKDFCLKSCLKVYFVE